MAGSVLIGGAEEMKETEEVYCVRFEKVDGYYTCEYIHNA